MRTSLPSVAFFLALAVPLASSACGLQKSETSGGGDPPRADAGAEADAPSCFGTNSDFPIQPPSCPLPCDEGTTAATCVNGEWQCPQIDGIACVVDAAPPPDACAEAPPISCVSECSGVTTNFPAVCSAGNWYCDGPSDCGDGGLVDAN